MCYCGVPITISLFGLSPTLVLQHLIGFYIYINVVFIINIHDKCRVWSNRFHFQFVNELVPFHPFSAYILFGVSLVMYFISRIQFYIWLALCYLSLFWHSGILFLCFTGVVLAFWNSVFMFHWCCFDILEFYFMFHWVCFVFLEFYFYVSLVLLWHSVILFLCLIGVALAFWNSILMFHLVCFR